MTDCEISGLLLVGILYVYTASVMDDLATRLRCLKMPFVGRTLIGDSVTAIDQTKYIQGPKEREERVNYESTRG